MHCTKCGHDNIEGATYCAQCGTPFTPSPEADENAPAGNRKVVKLPSDGADEVVAPIERPWEVRVPKRDASTPGNSGKMSTARKKPGATGKIPAIKRPATPEPEDIPSAEPGKAVVGASIGGAAANTSSFKPVDPSKNAAGREHTPTPRRVQKDKEPNVAIGGGANSGGGKKTGIIIAILILCLAAIAVAFFLTSGKTDKMVTFETNGGTSIAQQEIIDGGKLDRPANPVREGYTFEGWYLDASYTEPASFPIDVTEDMTLYAKWKPNASASSSSSSASSSSSPSASTATDSEGTSNSNSGSWSGAIAGGGTSNGDSGSGSDNSSASNGGDASTSNGGSDNSPNGDSKPADDGSTAKVSVTTRDGATLSGTVHLTNGYVIPNSSEKAYTIKELKALDLNDAELCIARNEPYARMGYSFKNPGLQAYFNARSWYHNTGWRGELPEDSAGYITAHNLLTIAQDSASASKWLRLKMS